jgi:hypothetical protein
LDLLDMDTAAEASTTALPDPPRPGDLIFDGSPVDLERVLAYIRLQALLYPLALSTDSRKSAYLLSHFRGPAIDWAATYIQSRAAAADTHDQLVNRVKTAFGYDSAQQQAIAQTRLGAIHHQGDLMEFLVEFDNLCNVSGINADTSKITLLLPKLKATYREAITRSGELITNYSTMRNNLGNIYARESDMKNSAEKQRKKKTCGKCGKRGHTASQCEAKN